MKRLIALAAVLALAGACGESKPETPACDTVWKVGATIDLNTYEGCTENGEVATWTTAGCYDVDDNYVGQFVTHGNLWVVQTGTDRDGTGGTPGKVTDVDPEC